MTATLDPEAMVTRYLQWALATLKLEALYLIVTTGGSARFNTIELAAGRPISIVQTGIKGTPLAPLRDNWIYPVAEGTPGVDELSVATAQFLHQSMSGVAKLGSQITLGEIHVWARLQVLSRLATPDEDDALPAGEPSGLPPEMGVLGAAVDLGTVPVESKEPLPATAVQIVVGDTVMSDPFRTEAEARGSPQYAALQALPDVLSGAQMLWLRPLHD